MVTYFFKHSPLPERLYQYTWILVRYWNFFKKKKKECSSSDCNENRFNCDILNTYNVKKIFPEKGMLKSNL